jgi:hypothetical protein
MPSKSLQGVAGSHAAELGPSTTRTRRGRGRLREEAGGEAEEAGGKEARERTSKTRMRWAPSADFESSTTRTTPPGANHTSAARSEAEGDGIGREGASQPRALGVAAHVSEGDVKEVGRWRRRSRRTRVCLGRPRGIERGARGSGGGDSARGNSVAVLEDGDDAPGSNSSSDIIGSREWWRQAAVVVASAPTTVTSSAEL